MWSVCRQVTTGSGELPSHIGYEADERYGRAAAVRKAEATRYASLGSGKANSGPGRSMHASPARLIITSGASKPSSRDDAMAHAASGDLNRADSAAPRAQHAQRVPSISVVRAPDPSGPAADQSAVSEALLQHQRQASPPHRHVQSASLSGQAPAEQAGSMRSETAQTPAEAQMAAAYNQQYGMALPQQHGHATGSAEHAHLASAAGQMPGSPFPTRVDSLSGWARQSEAQQRSNSPQSSGYAGSQPRGSFDFEQGQYVHRAGDQET